MRLGFILGFLFGGGIATLLGNPSAADTPGVTGEGSARANPIKQHIEEAKEAALEAKLDKEAEMLRLYDDMVHRRTPHESA